jgi:predicted kinase
MDANTRKRLADDLLEGADAIADWVYGSPKKRRKVYHLAQNTQFPIFRLGSVLCALKSEIDDYIAEQLRRRRRWTVHNSAGNNHKAVERTESE